MGDCRLVLRALCLLHSRQKSTDDPEMLFSTLQQQLVIPRLPVLPKSTQQFHKLPNISGQCLVASWHKAVPSAGATAFRKAENQDIGPYCREAELDLQKKRRISAP